MSHQLIDLSPDLQRLQAEGYHLEVRDGYLLVKDIPYLDGSLNVKEDGVLISQLEMSGNKTVKPSNHVAYWMNDDHPHRATGAIIETIQNSSQPLTLGVDFVASFTFSAKSDYPSYYEKITTYVDIISREAQCIREGVTAKTFKKSVFSLRDSVFMYENTAVSRDNTGEINQRVSNLKIGIIGVGGTGSYVLDMVAKTEVKEIHIFDGDDFLQHNAFRSPGAAKINDLARNLKKVDYWNELYSSLHKHIYPHSISLNENNIGELEDLDFLFICSDDSGSKRHIISALEKMNKSFIDVGIGVNRIKAEGDLSQLDGMLRINLSDSKNRSSAKARIPYSNTRDDEYSTNIQVAELNALNASLAVIRWKKLFNIYRNVKDEHHTTYCISFNELVNEDKGDGTAEAGD